MTHPSEIQVLAISFTGLIRQLAANEIQITELKHALYFFGCAREHVMAPGAAGEVDERKWYKGGYNAYDRLLPAVQSVEADDRVRWRDQGKKATVLNELLRQNGLNECEFAETQEPLTYPAIRDAMARANPDVRVVF